MKASQRKTIVIAVTGGTGSGKTTLVEMLRKSLGPEKVAVLAQDSYYLDQSHLPAQIRAELNFDHPDSIETSLLITHLCQLKQGLSVEIPTYDFATHSRRTARVSVEPRPVILVEGTLLLASEPLRREFDLSLFLDASSDIRFIRRLKRDTSERSRSTLSVIDQYLNTVKPMHDLYVDPSKRFADLVIPESSSSAAVMEFLLGGIKALQF